MRPRQREIVDRGRFVKQVTRDGGVTWIELTAPKLVRTEKALMENEMGELALLVRAFRRRVESTRNNFDDLLDMIVRIEELIMLMGHGGGNP
jgi:hypothetical protein